MKSPTNLLWLAAAMLLVAACKLNGPMPEPQTRKYRACSTDADCIVAQNGCCDCANGGEDIAIHRDQARAFQARFQCSGGCTEMAGDCARGTARCDDHLCTYHEPDDAPAP